MLLNLVEVKDNIVEELHDAVKYMTNAIEHKSTEWGTLFCQMSSNELNHANILLKMFNKSERPKTITDAEYTKMYRELLEEYEIAMSKIESMKKIYWSD